MKIVAVLILISYAIVIWHLLSNWRAIGATTRKILAFFVLGLFPLTWAVSVSLQDLERVKQVSFCEKCHTMKPYVDILRGNDHEPLSALHYQNNWVKQESACYECHTSYTMFGPIEAKLKGLKHLYVYYIQGGVEEPELYEPYRSRECLRCHGPSRRYLKMKKHTKDENLLKDLVAGKRSCMESDCHTHIHKPHDEVDASVGADKEG